MNTPAQTVPASPPANSRELALGTRLDIKALLLGERIDTRRLESQELLGRMPLIGPVDEGGITVLFRYGVVVLFNVPPEAERAFLQRIWPLVSDRFASPDIDEAQVFIQPDGQDQVDVGGRLSIRAATVERLQLVADVFAKSLLLAHYETQIAATFDLVEPLANTLGRTGRVGREGHALLRQIGAVLSIQQQTIGRAGTADTPDLLWDHPELGRLYAQMADEYELREREQALDRKLDVISRTLETLVDLSQQRSTLRLEWYVVILIIVEIAISIYSLLWPR
jgi:required for meiotic nuclear division protein 1